MRKIETNLLGIALIVAFFLVSVSAQAQFTIGGGSSPYTSVFAQNPVRTNPRPEPPTCPTYWNPVCGANGVTYSNTCFAGSVGIAYGGECCVEADGDRICDPDDQCIGNDAWGDEDGDGICEDIDACRGNDALGDMDGDGSCDDTDLCIGDDRNGDLDGDGTCEELDGFCSDPDTDPQDSDGDGICDYDDICPEHADVADGDLDGRCDHYTDGCPNDHYNDRDLDSCCDSADVCPLDPADDEDGDGFCANNDFCLGFNDTGDSDGDGICDDRDLCIGDDSNGDSDSDGICDVLATCDDLTGTDWGSCAPHPLGAAVMGTTCQMIFGCEVPPGIVIWANVTECEANCTGCTDNSQCAPEDYCRFPDYDSCGLDSLGSCFPRAEVCAQIYDPVCGCDGLIYSSYCHAEKAGMNAAHYGECGSCQ